MRQADPFETSILHELFEFYKRTFIFTVAISSIFAIHFCGLNPDEDKKKVFIFIYLIAIVTSPAIVPISLMFGEIVTPIHDAYIEMAHKFFLQAKWKLKNIINYIPEKYCEILSNIFQELDQIDKDLKTKALIQFKTYENAQTDVEKGHARLSFVSLIESVMSQNRQKESLKAFVELPNSTQSLVLEAFRNNYLIKSHAEAMFDYAQKSYNAALRAKKINTIFSWFVCDQLYFNPDAGNLFLMEASTFMNTALNIIVQANVFTNTRRLIIEPKEGGIRLPPSKKEIERAQTEWKFGIFRRNNQKKDKSFDSHHVVITIPQENFKPKKD